MPLAPLGTGLHLPALLVIQGSADTIVAASNGAQVAQLWADREGGHAGQSRIVQRGKRCAAMVTDYRNRLLKCMPVHLITENLLIDPNPVFIIPSNRDLLVEDEFFELKPISKPRSWPDVIAVMVSGLHGFERQCRGWLGSVALLAASTGERSQSGCINRPCQSDVQMFAGSFFNFPFHFFCTLCIELGFVWRKLIQ